ncbi:hypothetical protein GCM10028799_25980 [Kribbella italica]|nr:cupin domain-containing protein [Kribbella italica]
MKAEREFFPVDQVEWTDAGNGISQRILSEGPEDNLTRIARWAPGTTTDEVIRHEYFEEVYLLEGSLTDLTLQRTFGPGEYAARHPGMPHGPYSTDEGCTMLEIRYPAG